MNKDIEIILVYLSLAKFTSLTIGCRENDFTKTYVCMCKIFSSLICIHKKTIPGKNVQSYGSQFDLVLYKVQLNRSHINKRKLQRVLM